MNASSNASPEAQARASHEAPVDLAFELPVQSGYRELPPKGTWEAGYELSLMALDLVKNRPEIWQQRHARMMDTEFVM